MTNCGKKYFKWAGSRGKVDVFRVLLEDPENVSSDQLYHQKKYYEQE